MAKRDGRIDSVFADVNVRPVTKTIGMVVVAAFAASDLHDLK